MIVFPAFDTNYKARKRTFKCCDNCRKKRIKCDITLTRYSEVGCAKCRELKLTCSLIDRTKAAVVKRDDVCASKDSDTTSSICETPIQSSVNSPRGLLSIASISSTGSEKFMDTTTDIDNPVNSSNTTEKPSFLTGSRVRGQFRDGIEAPTPKSMKYLVNTPLSSRETPLNTPNSFLVARDGNISTSPTTPEIYEDDLNKYRRCNPGACVSKRLHLLLDHAHSKEVKARRVSEPLGNPPYRQLAYDLFNRQRSTSEFKHQGYRSELRFNSIKQEFRPQHVGKNRSRENIGCEGNADRKNCYREICRDRCGTHLDYRNSNPSSVSSSPQSRVDSRPASQISFQNYGSPQSDDSLATFDTQETRTRPFRISCETNHNLPLIENVYEAQYNVNDMSSITPEHLHNLFGFNVTDPPIADSYLYILNGDPRFIVASAFKECSIWDAGSFVKLHLLCVNPKDRTAGDLTSQSLCVSNTHSPSKSTVTTHHILNVRTYHTLLGIWAFTLLSEKWQFTQEETIQLLEIFFYKVNSVFPLVHEQVFWTNFHNGRCQNVLLYLMILVVLHDVCAKPILEVVFSRAHRYPSTFVADRLDLMADLEYKLRQILLILPQLGDTDKFQRMVVSLILTLHCSYDSFGAERNAHDLTDAVNLAMSIGIHTKPRHQMLKDHERRRYFANVWWCCYVLDRFNGMFNMRGLFVQEEDFDIDLPYDNPNLLLLVQMGRQIQLMMHAVYRPLPESTDREERYNHFDQRTFENNEFELCAREQQKSLPETDYSTSATHFLNRIASNVVIIVLQKIKYDDVGVANGVPESLALKGAENILWYMTHELEKFLNIPLVPWSMTLAMSVALKREAMNSTNDEGLFGGIPKSQGEYEKYLRAAERFRETWWVVEETCLLAEKVVERIKSADEA